MKIENLVISGEGLFIKRRSMLVETLKGLYPNVHVVVTGNYYETSTVGKLESLYYQLLYRRKGKAGVWAGMLKKSPQAFRNNSRAAAATIEALPFKPDMILHFHGMYIPRDTPTIPGIPFCVFTDYTAAQAIRNWQPWAPQRSSQGQQAWMEAQKSGFHLAEHLFTYASVTRDSMITDYGLSPAKITVAGHAGDTLEPYAGEKTLGSQQLLFNGSDWKRKGGDIALAAFAKVREKFPKARLLIIGGNRQEAQPGVEYVGNVSDRAELHRLFLGSDILLSPARCDPLPTLGVEVMNFGVIPVVSDRDGMPEMVDFGRCGSVASLDAQSVADEVIKLFSDPGLLKQKSDAARERVRDLYNWPEIARKMSRVWEELPEPAGKAKAAVAQSQASAP